MPLIFNPPRPIAKLTEEALLALKAGFITYLSVLLLVNLVAIPNFAKVQNFGHEHPLETPWHLHDVKVLFSSLISSFPTLIQPYQVLLLGPESKPCCLYLLLPKQFLARAPPQARA